MAFGTLGKKDGLESPTLKGPPTPEPYQPRRRRGRPIKWMGGEKHELLRASGFSYVDTVRERHRPRVEVPTILTSKRQKGNTGVAKTPHTPPKVVLDVTHEGKKSPGEEASRPRRKTSEEGYMSPKKVGKPPKAPGVDGVALRNPFGVLCTCTNDSPCEGHAPCVAMLSEEQQEMGESARSSCDQKEGKSHIKKKTKKGMGGHGVRAPLQGKATFAPMAPDPSLPGQPEGEDVPSNMGTRHDRIVLHVSIKDDGMVKLDPRIVDWGVPHEAEWVGGTRRRRKENRPSFGARDAMDWMLRPSEFERVMHMVETYHQEKGWPPPPHFMTEWTDGCCDVLGNNKQLPRFCSPKNSFFQQSWVGKNVYANPPFHREETGDFLRKYIEDAKVATGSKVVTRGLFIVPVWPNAPWWHLTSMFEVLHVWKKGEDNIFTAPPLELGGERCVMGPIPFDVAVLYDPGNQMLSRPSIAPLVYALNMVSQEAPLWQGDDQTCGDVLESTKGESRDSRRRARSRLAKQRVRHGPLGWYSASLPKSAGGKGLTCMPSWTSNPTENRVAFQTWGECACDDTPKAWPCMKFKWERQVPDFVLENFEEAMRCRSLHEKGQGSFVVELCGQEVPWGGTKGPCIEPLMHFRQGWEDNSSRKESSKDEKVDRSFPSSPVEVLACSWAQGGKRSIASMQKGGGNKDASHECIVLTIEHGGLKFDALVDSGATHSVLNRQWFLRRGLSLGERPGPETLEVANGQCIEMYGEVMWDIWMHTNAQSGCNPKAGGKSKKVRCAQDFVVADLGETYPCILGMDWLTKNEVLIDPCTKCVCCRALGNAWACSNMIPQPPGGDPFFFQPF